ncbi:MAG: response regulator transcription factor [Clostridiales bacterium]|nr:response regulator transcription factor [Clostridiales bacterium]
MAYRRDTIKTTILLVEDDMAIRNTVAKFLSKEGYEILACPDGDTAQGWLYDKDFQLAIFDIMLPGVNGHELLSELRKIKDTPVLMLSALSDCANQVRAFKQEADDYVTKPFSLQVLLGRIEALLRRSGHGRKEICVGSLTLYPETLKVQVLESGEFLDLSPKEFDLLRLLARNRGRIVPHETLLVQIWGYNFEGNESIIHATMKKLRDKLPNGAIKTVRGVGYRLEAEL